MSTPSPKGLEVYATLPGVRVGGYRLVHLVAYHATPSVTALRTSDRHHRMLRGRFPDRTAILSWIAPGLSVPDKDVRKLGADLFKGVAPHIKCSATVIAGGGFWASTARSVLTGIQLLSRSACPNRAFAEVDDAARWVVGYLDEGAEVDAEGLIAAMRFLIE